MIAALRRQREAGGGNPDISDEGIWEEYLANRPKQYASNSPEGRANAAAQEAIFAALRVDNGQGTLGDRLRQADPSIRSIGVTAGDPTDAFGTISFSVQYVCVRNWGYGGRCKTAREILEAVDKVERVRPLVIRMREQRVIDEVTGRRIGARMVPRTDPDHCLYVKD
jgi:hypothetical protein